MIKCTCGDHKCNIRIYLDPISKNLSIYGPNDELIIMFLNANGTVELIKQLKSYLLSLTKLEGE